MTPHVKFSGVSKSYINGNFAVRNLDLVIKKGEFLSFLGPSGSGKTTTLMMLAGFVECDKGELELEGKLISQTPPYKRGIGMVFQNYALFPHLTVAENLAFPLKIRSLSKERIRERISWSLDLVSLQDFEHRMPQQLSGGQQQRVALARALIFEPSIVLMDEPLGALDKKLRDQMQLELKKIQKKLGVTVVYVTHDQTEAMTMSDRIAIFNKGEIMQIGSPRDLYEFPSNSFVASFMGDNNLLEGKILSSDTDYAHVKLKTGQSCVGRIANPIADGSDCLIGIRPENLRILTTTNHEILFSKAEITNLIFVGDHFRVELLSYGKKIIARYPASKSLNFEIGSVVHISFEEDNASVIPN